MRTPSFYMTHRRFGLLRKQYLIGFLVLGLVLLGVGLSHVARDRDTAIVTRVIDGDTVELQGGMRVRYIGIDAPEKGEPYYLEALEANRNLVEGKRVRLEKDVEDKDKYGRLLRYVWVDDIMVNAELVRLGYACSHTYPPNVKYQELLLHSEWVAKEQGQGLWSSRCPVCGG